MPGQINTNIRICGGNIMSCAMPIPEAPEKAVFDPLQRIENQCSEKAKTMFETSRTTSNVVFLMSYVSIPFCGRFFVEWGMTLSDKWKKCMCFVWRKYNSRAGK